LCGEALVPVGHPQRLANHHALDFFQRRSSELRTGPDGSCGVQGIPESSW
jgi:hypothetical protein